MRDIILLVLLGFSPIIAYAVIHVIVAYAARRKARRAAEENSIWFRIRSRKGKYSLHRGLVHRTWIVCCDDIEDPRGCVVVAEFATLPVAIDFIARMHERDSAKESRAK